MKRKHMRVTGQEKKKKTKSTVNSRKNKRPHKSSEEHLLMRPELGNTGYELTEDSKTAAPGSVLRKRELGKEPWQCEGNHWEQ